MSSIAEIQRATAAHFGLTRAELLGRGQARRYFRPRQLSMAIAREDGHSLKKIAQHFGRDHTTVLHATRVVSRRGDEVTRDIEAIRESMKQCSSLLVGAETNAAAVKAIGEFCAAFGVSRENPRQRGGSIQHRDTKRTENTKGNFGAPKARQDDVRGRSRSALRVSVPLCPLCLCVESNLRPHRI